jgi:hypothetical protein
MRSRSSVTASWLGGIRSTNPVGAWLGFMRSKNSAGDHRGGKVSKRSTSCSSSRGQGSYSSPVQPAEEPWPIRIRCCSRRGDWEGGGCDILGSEGEVLGKTGARDGLLIGVVKTIEEEKVPDLLL